MGSKKEKTAGEILKEIEPTIGKEIIMNLDFRGNRILLPEVITKITKFNDKEELTIKADKGKLQISKLSIEKEK